MAVSSCNDIQNMSEIYDTQYAFSPSSLCKTRRHAESFQILTKPKKTKTKFKWMDGILELTKHAIQTNRKKDY